VPTNEAIPKSTIAISFMTAIEQRHKVCGYEVWLFGFSPCLDCAQASKMLHIIVNIKGQKVLMMFNKVNIDFLVPLLYNETR
jgi:hypothetical protein